MYYLEYYMVVALRRYFKRTTPRVLRSRFERVLTAVIMIIFCRLGFAKFVGSRKHYQNAHLGDQLWGGVKRRRRRHQHCFPVR